MKRKIWSFVLCVLMLFTTVFSVMPISASEAYESITVSYVCESGDIPAGISAEQVYRDLSSAVDALADGGIVYVIGDVTLPSLLATQDKESSVTIKGYPGASGRILFTTSGAAFNGNFAFDSITLKAQPIDERWVKSTGGTLTFGADCDFELSDVYTQNGAERSTGLYIGHNSASNADFRYVCNSPDIVYTMLSPVGGYSSSNYAVKGDAEFDLNDGIFTSVYGGIRNGNGSTTLFQKLYGDATFNINGGTYTSIYTNNVNGGYVFGNVVFNINGGTYTDKSKLVFGNGNSKLSATNVYTADYSSVSNLAVIFNTKELAENASAISLMKVSEHESFAGISCDNSMLIINNSEITGYTPSISVSNVDYLIKTQNGKTVPVFADTDTEGNAGAFLGFDITADNKGYAPYVSGKALTKNANGYYDIPKSASGTYTEVKFENPLAGQYFTATFGTPEYYTSVEGEGNTSITLPFCTVSKSGYYFAGWICGEDGLTYASGGKYIISKATAFTADWKKADEVKYIYVSASGSDESSGVTRYAPMKTLTAAVSRADEIGVSNIVVTSPIQQSCAIPAGTNRLTISGKDDTTDFGGSLVVTASSNVLRPVTFENMGLACNSHQYICTGSNHVIFGEGLTGVGDLGIYAHFGKQYGAADSVNVEIKSGVFKSTYLGGAYLRTAGTGVVGDARLALSSNDNFDVAVGFDGYTGNNSDGTIDGSVEITVHSGSVSNITSVRLTEIKGALYAICYGSAIVPDISEFPRATKGEYSIRVVSGGTVTAATDENGQIMPGYVRAVCDDESKAVRVTVSNGAEYIYDQGNFYLYPGNYTVEFVEKGSLEALSFTVDAPVSGFPAEKQYFSTDKYFAIGEWYCDGVPVSRFEFRKKYNLVIKVTPSSAIDTSALSSAKINGSTSKVTMTANEDGTYTVNYNYGQILSNIVRYVSESSGSDSNDGTATAPFATLNKAISSLSSRGGVIYITDSVHCGGTYPSNTKKILITGDGYKDAELYIRKNGGAVIGGDLIFENIKITMEEFSHFNDMGHNVMFADNASVSKGKTLHLATYGTRGGTSANVTTGRSVELSGVFLGGAYHGSETNQVGPVVSGDIEYTLRGSVSSLVHGCDSYQPYHVGSTLEGNVLITLDGTDAQIGKITSGNRALTVSNDTVYQFIFNNSASILGDIAEGLIPAEKMYTIYSGVGGRVFHAKDENGKSVSGSFDIVPDEGNYAIIKYNNHLALTRGGRYEFPSNTKINVSYVSSDYPIESYLVELNGGLEEGRLFRIDDEGNITFIEAPVKKNYIFEGWYYDEALTQLAKNGDYVGKNIELYAKYSPFSVDEADEQFVIRGVQMRLPDSSSEIQGLRFITITDNDAINMIASFSDKNSAMLRPTAGYNTHYGTVVLPNEILGTCDLTLDSTYYYGGKAYSSRFAKGENLFASTSDKTEYTVCLLDISPEKYEYAYTARPYLKYYTRSGNLATLYGTPYSTDVMKTTFAALESGNESDEAEEYLRNTILPEYAAARDIELLPTEVLDMIDTKTEQYKQNVINSPNMSLSGVTGTVYYVSPNGNDSNSGKSPSAAWKTLAKVSATTFKSGDVILFERGAEFRGKITAKASGLTFSAYGTGAKPIINGSKRDFADPSIWVETDVENVYKLTVTVSDVGLVALDHSKKLGVYDELMGTMRVSGVTYNNKLFTDYRDLDTDLHYYSDLATGVLYMYSSKGNPGERFSSIEIGEDGDLLEISSRTGMTIDNIDFRYGGGHGIGGSGGLANFDSNGNFTKINGCADLTVTNCIFSWIGGSNLRDTTRYGNAVEIFGSVDGYLVENNWIYQIYDTAITHQVSGTTVGDTLMQDILYKNNLMEYCHWSIEFYNQNCECCIELETPKHKRIVRDVLSEGNIVRMGGYGWGSRIRKEGATLYNSFGLSRVESETSNFHAKNNIFFRCTGGLYRVYNNASEDNLTFESNLWIQDYSGILAWYKNATYIFTNGVEDYIIGEESHLKEVNNTGVYFYTP